MFKKLVSIALAAMMLVSTAAIAANAAEADEAVAAADDSAVGAADDSAVGADGSEATGAGQKIYFQVDNNLWKNFKKITFYFYEHGGDELITWGSKKGNMTDEGNGLYSYDLADNGLSMDSSKVYGCIFTADWNAQTCDLIIGNECIGKTASCTGEQVENNVDSNKKSYYVKWDSSVDSSKYAPPLTITSIGNIVGEALWPGETKYSMFVKFLTSDGTEGLSNALKYNKKDEQKTIDDTANTLGLKLDDVKAAVAEAKAAGKTLDWDESKSTLAAGSSGDANTGNNSSNSSNNSSNSSSNSSSSSSRSSGSSSVSSGQETTIFFVFAGVMLAAAGVIFLARKKREE